MRRCGHVSANWKPRGLHNRLRPTITRRHGRRLLSRFTLRLRWKQVFWGAPVKIEVCKSL
jgi:hypothetical protein